ncbi:NAD(P)-binding protein [Bimuria novae-zelandiae CBS 107.79]|uniref:D-xylose 1-dehydrogenase (NADP(+), D-xylono-1,5-lactone-forming) n=1 Tax=Bimuria novae-zelandiae CBS 107.79 TaxID=1447943 RepID=A0A6A5V8S5_9PLEO|nr:NAD(P)-binding protein [Bimuria novae-zelandiae CBS 107.79]
MSSPKTIRWGILATGGIAKTFTKDLLVNPATRGVKHLKHTVVAAASSSSASRAQDFLKDTGSPSDAKAYGSYEELVNDPNVDIIYIATPHSHHYQNAMLALEAGKPVLCEKAFTVNAEQLRKLAEKAKEKNLFLMEAVWTRYFPLSVYVREQIKSGRIGPIARVFADNSMASDPEVQWKDGTHRMVNPELAGGALLDLGIYSLTWVFQTLYHTQPENDRKPPKVLAAMKNYGPTQGADETTTIVLSFPRSEAAGGEAHAIATTSIRVATSPAGKQDVPGIRIQGPKGEIQVFPPAYRPTRTRIVLKDGTVEEKDWLQPGPGAGSGWVNGFGGSTNVEGEGHGMFWEADEAADAVINGRKEGRYEGLDESILIMEVMDETRKQGGLKYPEKIETTKYPTQL